MTKVLGLAFLTWTAFNVSHAAALATSNFQSCNRNRATVSVDMAGAGDDAKKDIKSLSEIIDDAVGVARVFSGVAVKVASIALDAASDMVPKETYDISIPYDAAARLAYDEWRDKYGKEDVDLERFGIFKKNYESMTIENVSAKKRAREDVEGKGPEIDELNEYADLSEEEYKELMKSMEPLSWEEIFVGAASIATTLAERAVSKLIPTTEESEPPAKPAPISFLGSPKPTPAPSPSSSLFGGLSPSKPTNPEKRGSVGIPKKAPPAAARRTPVLTQWKQNPDGTVTGKAFGARNVRNGKGIVTNPPLQKPKSGVVVTSKSGILFRLK